MSKWRHKREPRQRGLYFVTIEDKYTEKHSVALAERYNELDDNSGQWHWFIQPNGCATGYVIAWQKCPEPYEYWFDKD